MQQAFKRLYGTYIVVIELLLCLGIACGNLFVRATTRLRVLQKSRAKGGEPGLETSRNHLTFADLFRWVYVLTFSYRKLDF